MTDTVTVVAGTGSSSVPGGTALSVVGTWDANANAATPFSGGTAFSLASSTGTVGQAWIVSVGGATTLDGIVKWDIGDFACFFGGVWRRIAGPLSYNAANMEGTFPSGLLKSTGSSGLLAAVAGTDYLAPPSGSAIQKANSGGALVSAVAGTDYAVPITANGMLKGDGAGNVSAAVAGTDFGKVVSGTPVATTSGTYVDITLPITARRVCVTLNNFSTNNNSSASILIGPSGGVESTGYTSMAQTGGSSASLTTGFLLVSSNNSSYSIGGHIWLTLHDSSANTWVMSSVTYRSDGNVSYSAGSKSIAGTLSKVRLYCAGDTFDLGSMNYYCEP